MFRNAAIVIEEPEFGNYKGLNLIPENVKNINEVSDEQLKVPNIGWNEIQIKNKNNFFEKFNNNSFYFVHLYQLQIKKRTHQLIANITIFKFQLLLKNKIIGCQFHPEKSGENGLKF